MKPINNSFIKVSNLKQNIKVNNRMKSIKKLMKQNKTYK